MKSPLLCSGLVLKVGSSFLIDYGVTTDNLEVSASPAPRANKSDTQDNKPGIQAARGYLSVKRLCSQATDSTGGCPSRSLGRVVLSALFPHYEVSSDAACPYQVFQLLLQIWQEAGVWETQRTRLWLLPEQADSESGRSQPGGPLDSYVGHRGYASKSQVLG